MKTARNIAIIVALAALVSFAPGGFTASATIGNLLSIVFIGGLAFFAYRTYRENRSTLSDLPENRRLILYASAAALGFALIATSRIWNTEGPWILLWFALIGAAGYGFLVVARGWREY